MTEVRLSWDELEFAYAVAIRRAIESKSKGFRDRHGCDPADWLRVNVEAYPAELAVARHTGLCWRGPEPYRRGAPDVGFDVEVRSTDRRDGSLIVHEDDHDDRRFVLVIRNPTDPRTYDLVGWTWGKSAKDPRYWRTDTGRPAYFHPRHGLTPL